MQRNTETLGNIFDQQPSAPAGNIHCITNSNLPVVGYVSIGTVQTKRIFIDRLALPQGWLYVSPYECNIQSFFYVDPNNRGLNTVALFLIPKTSINQPIDSIKPMDSLKVIGFTSARPECEDCTIHGTLKQPPFWK